MAGIRITQLHPQHATGRRYGSFAGRSPATLAAVTGTATASITEADLVTGGKTLIVTLTNDTWVPAGAAFNAQRQAILNGLTSAQGEATGWNATIRDTEVVGAVVRTSDTVVTVTLTASFLYNITAEETITVTVPASALVTSLIAVVATPTFTVSVFVPTPTINYQAGGGGGTPPRKRKKRKRDADRLFADIERTLRELVYGTTSTVAPMAPVGAVDISHGIERAIDQLAAMAEANTDFSVRLSKLRQEVSAYEHRQRRAMQEDEEEVWMLM